MGALGGHLADGLDVRLGMLPSLFWPNPAGWTVRTDDGHDHGAHAVVLTCPVPQALSLAVAAGVEVPGGLRDVGYERTIALLRRAGRADRGAAAGRVQDGDAPFSFVADNAAKGISPVPALTLHTPTRRGVRPTADGDATRSAPRCWPPPARGSRGSESSASTVKRWRYATPTARVARPLRRAGRRRPGARGRRLRRASRRGRLPQRPGRRRRRDGLSRWITRCRGTTTSDPTVAGGRC